MRWWTPDAVAMVVMVGGLVWIVGFYSGRLYERALLFRTGFFGLRRIKLH